ncbi:rhomboid-domain-containing protein [Gonapodya prolifera JEL478]|uniref:Rhomboid-domain-containing protein n=1 Tax=Gonapodya prolifera (strain JEL478) TaxID=1344416 RepID=A0A139AUY3_GONPJ|nr:rhomboid-domain-containing protein [Gonapodya prolifera JEL478]|eukprot:KXS20509.1 rhomboid-domain-containing protein [Gonapodya prolifera JEL478]
MFFNRLATWRSTVQVARSRKLSTYPPPPLRVAWVPQAIFTAAVTVTSFGAAVWLDARDISRKAEDDARQRRFGFFGLLGSESEVVYNRGSTRRPEGFFERISSLVRAEWDRLSKSDRTVGGIVAVNTIVFLAWQVKSLETFMANNFLHHPLSGRSFTLLTSAFSHMSIGHLAFNMFALWSFGSSVINRVFGSTNEFLAFYFSSAAIASLGSHALTIAALRRGAVGSKLPVLLRKTHIEDVSPSLGASGAVFAVVGSVYALFPYTGVNVMFIPYSFDLMSVDLVGLIRGWKVLDHGAHLSGSLFGIGYTQYGTQLYNVARDRLIKTPPQHD